MTTRDVNNQPLAYSLLAGREVSTASEEWRQECEVSYLLEMTPEKRRAMFEGVQGALGDEARGIKAHRGNIAASFLAEEIDRLKDLRKRG